jgi:mRNA interferase HigB
MAMTVLNAAVLDKFSRKHSDAKVPLRAWLSATLPATWRSIDDVRRTFPHADGVPLKGKGVATVFNIGGNKYRLITRVDYARLLVVVREVLTHAEYNKDSWKGRF